jgi:hypothetical protein
MSPLRPTVLTISISQVRKAHHREFRVNIESVSNNGISSGRRDRFRHIGQSDVHRYGLNNPDLHEKGLVHEAP